jgi:hypothetical protein
MPNSKQESSITNNIIGVKFPTGRNAVSSITYYYFNNIPDLKFGDWLIVIVRQQPVCAMVTELNVQKPYKREKAFKWTAFKISIPKNLDPIKPTINIIQSSTVSINVNYGIRKLNFEKE